MQKVFGLWREEILAQAARMVVLLPLLSTVGRMTTIFEAAELTEDERKLVLLGLKVLAGDVKMSRGLGWPVTIKEIRDVVRKLGGRPELL